MILHTKFAFLMVAWHKLIYCRNSYGIFRHSAERGKNLGDLLLRVEE